MTHELNVELEFVVQKDNTEQKLNNNVGNPGDEKVKRRNLVFEKLNLKDLFLFQINICNHCLSLNVPRLYHPLIFLIYDTGGE